MKPVNHAICLAVVAFYEATIWPPILQAKPAPATGVVIAPNKGGLVDLIPEFGTPLLVTFPTPMVELDRVNRGGQPSPVIFEPTVEFRWKWVSQTEGEIVVPYLFQPRTGASEGGSNPAPILYIPHRARLRPDLHDLEGRPVDVTRWSVEFTEEKFTLRRVSFLNASNLDDDEDNATEDNDTKGQDGKHEEDGTKSGNEKKDRDDKKQPHSDGDDDKESKGDKPDKVKGRDPDSLLPTMPRARLEFSRNVLAKDVAANVYYLDRQTNERFPVEVILEERQQATAQGWFLIEPTRPLPPGHTLQLMVEPFREPAGRQVLPQLWAIPAGKTMQPTFGEVCGHNQPGVGAFFEAVTDQPLDASPDNLKNITVVPPVNHCTVVPTEGGFNVNGDFETGKTYTLKAGADLLSDLGFRFAVHGAWKVTFHPKRPAVIFPDLYSYQRASAPRLRVPFTQVNTDALTWKLARIDPKKLKTVVDRLREFGDRQYDAQGVVLQDEKTGENLYRDTELLIPALHLPVVASGPVEASSGDRETARTVEWTPADSKPDLLLLEISGKDQRGRLVGNRIIVSRTDWMVSKVSNGEETHARILNVNNGEPVPGVRVQRLNEKGEAVQTAVTDALGEMTLSGDVAEYFMAGPAGRQCLQDAELSRFEQSKSSREDNPDEDAASGKEGETGVIVTDRNVYRPGETVKFKGFLREFDHGKLRFKAAKNVEVTIASDDNIAVQKISRQLAANGSFSGEWLTSELDYGDYTVTVGTVATTVTVSDFRQPPFSNVVEAEPVRGTTATAKVTSALFHGAPNANAKVSWKAEWLADDWVLRPGDRTDDDPVYKNYALDDEHSPNSATGGLSRQIISDLRQEGWQTARDNREVTVSATSRGEATLDANGQVTLHCACPFPPGTHGRARVFWLVDVTSKDTAQTMRGGAVARAQLIPQVLGVALQTPTDETARISVASFDADEKPAAGLTTKAELFTVEIKTAKEQLTPGLSRYRNTPIFTKVWEGEIVTPGVRDVPVKDGGQLVVRVTAPQQPGTPQVSAAVTADDSGMEINGDSSLQVTTEQRSCRVGEEIALDVQVPTAGTATVSVETDRVLGEGFFHLKSGLQKIPIKALPEYEPNVWITVHLIVPASGDTPPTERFGSCRVDVTSPVHRLEVATTLDHDTLAPGTTVNGMVKVTHQGTPAAGADVLVFAVDEAILALGNWKLPDFTSTFFPMRPLEVDTSRAVTAYWTASAPSDLDHAQKGFILGDGGPHVANTEFRRDFKALAFWNAQLRANAQGEVPFQFKAPSGLTTYRVVAVAQQGVDAFGQGRTALRLSKPLQVEPVLPDFLRQGDEAVVRAVVRQDVVDSGEVEVSLKTSLGVISPEAVARHVTARRGEPAWVDFPVHASPDATVGKIGFSASLLGQPHVVDAEEHTLGIQPAGIEREETVAGTFSPEQTIAISALAPAAWLGSTNGRCDVLLSGSPYLPKLAGLRAMLNAQGSTEKLATRILTATLLSRTLAFLPMEPGSREHLEDRISDALKALMGSVSSGGGLAAWPHRDKYDAVLAKRDDFDTVEGAWAVRNAALMKPKLVPASMTETATTWLRGMINQEIGFEDVSPQARCFALMAYSSSLGESEKAEAQTLETVVEELFDNRETLKLGTEEKSWVALSMHYLRILPEKKRALLAELDRPEQEHPLDPAFFGSGNRTEAIRLLAHSEIEALSLSPHARQQLFASFDRISKSSVDLSTQENLWLLILFDSLLQKQVPPRLQDKLAPLPPVLSQNKVSAGWLRVPLAGLETLPANIRSSVGGSYVLTAKYQAPADAAPSANETLSITRLARNLSDVTRTGTLEAPWHAGDQVLLTYHVNTHAPHSHLELEDQLPACLETVNPLLPAIAGNFPLPIDAGVNQLTLSHVELRTVRTLLYFDEAPAGESTYSILARVIVPGTFAWPSTQIRAMYDSRFSAMSLPGTVNAR